MKRIVVAASASLALTACSPSLPLAGGDPSLATPSSRSTPYRSLLKDYVRFEPVEPRPWRETNDRVRDLGGPDAQMQADSDEDALPQPKSR